MKLIRERSLADRQEALNSAFLALRDKSDTTAGSNDVHLADVNNIREALKILRPHYNDAKVSQSIHHFMFVFCRTLYFFCISSFPFVLGLD